MPPALRALLSLVIAFLGLTTLARGQTPWMEAARYQQTAYFLFDNRIERFDLQSDAWLPSVALPATGAKSIVASDRGVFVAIGTNIHRFDTNLTNRTLLTTTAQPVVQLLLDGSMLVATQTGAGITAQFYPLDGGSPLQSNIPSSTWDLLGQASIAPGLNKIFGRSSVRGPLDIVQATYQPIGGLIAVTDSPHAGGALPAGTKTYVLPGETRVADNAGIVYSTTDLSYVGSFGGAFTDIAPRADGSFVVLRGSRLSIHDAAYREVSVATFPKAATSLQLTASAAYGFFPETSARGVGVLQMAFTSFNAGTIPTAADPTGLSYTPDQIMVDRDGVLLLYSISNKTVFRWSPTERRYLPGIGIDGSPAQITYSPGEHALYMGSSTGAITRAEAVPGSANVSFANVPTKVEALFATGTHVLAVNYMSSDYWHRTFDRSGTQIDAKDRDSYSAPYEFSPESRTVFWFNDRSSGGRVFSEVIGANGILGPELEYPYLKSGNNRDTPPIRANANGSKMAIARGIIFGNSPMEEIYSTQRTSTDMGWLGDTLFSIEPLTGNHTTYNRWGSDWNVDRSRVLEGTPLRVLPGATQSIVVTLYNGSPRFHVLNAADDSTYDSVSGRAPVISGQPQDMRVDYGGTAIFRVLALGSGPFQYRWTKNGSEIPGVNSADLVITNCGSKSAANYQVTVTNGSGNVTSSVARLGVGPVRNSSYVPGNLLAGSGDRLYEVRTNGQVVRSMQIPNPYNGGFSHRVEDVAMDRLGRIHALHTGFEGGNEVCTLGTYDPEFGTWSQLRLRESFAPNFQELDFSIVGDTGFTNRQVSLDLLKRRSKLTPYLSQMSRHNLTAGQDGFVYGVASEGGKVHKYDPNTWTMLQTTTIDSSTIVGIYGAAAAANGTIYALTSNQRLYRVTPGANGGGTFISVPNSSYLDFNISKSGQIAMGAGGNVVVLSNTQLQAATSVTMQGISSSNSTYVGWVESPVIPSPAFAATPPTTTAEDGPFSFDPLATHVDPDKALTFALEAAPPWLSVDAATGKLTGTPLAAHIGTSQVRLKATDGFGVYSTLSFNLQVLEVNDLPVATNLSIVHPEDVAPFTTSLHDRFSDEETADTALNYQLVSNSNTGLATATVENGSLRITPVKDAFGSATIAVRATDAGGLSVDSQITLELTPVNDQPASTGLAVVHPEDVAPFALSLHDRFADVETADEALTYELISNSRAALATATVANGSLQITPVKDAFGLATIIVRATDVGGLSADSEITLELTPVNDQPVATNLSLQHPEDVAPFALSLHDRFADVETPDSALIYELVSNHNTSLATAAVANGSLQIAPVKDAFGFATIIVRATDVGGLSADSEITLELTPVNDPPVFATQVPDLTGLATGAPLELELGQFVFDADPGDTLLWALTNVSNPALFSQVSVAPQTGRLDIQFAPYVSGSSDLTVSVSDGAGTSASFTFRVTLPELPLPELAINATLGLNRQTGLYEQRVTITNEAQRAIAGFDLIVGGLPEGVKLNNATGTGEGTWIIRHRTPMAPGVSLVLTLEYAVSVRGTEFTPQLSVVLVTAPQAPAQATPGGSVPVTRCERLGDGSQLIEFDAVLGKSYEIQYSADTAIWLKSPVPVTAAGNRVQWIDRGPPRTDSPPASVGARFYRVVELSTAP